MAEYVVEGLTKDDKKIYYRTTLKDVDAIYSRFCKSTHSAKIYVDKAEATEVASALNILDVNNTWRVINNMNYE